MACIFFEKIFFVHEESKRALQYLKQIQVQMIVFNQKAAAKIYRISNSENPPWNLVKFRSEFFLVNASRKPLQKSKPRSKRELTKKIIRDKQDLTKIKIRKILTKITNRQLNRD